MIQYTINLTKIENLAMSYDVADQQDWIDNLVHERCRISIETIVSIAIQKCLESGVQVPGTKDEIVELAFTQGWVKSLADRTAEAMSNVPDAG